MAGFELLCLSPPHSLATPFEMKLTSYYAHSVRFTVCSFKDIPIFHAACFSVAAEEDEADAHLPSYTIRSPAHDLLSFIFTHSMGNNGLKGKQAAKSFWK